MFVCLCIRIYNSEPADPFFPANSKVIWSPPTAARTEERRQYNNKWTKLQWKLSFYKGDKKCTLLKKIP
jgi:hypothetical protein